MDDNNPLELKEKDYILIMENASNKFNKMSLRWGDRTSLCRAYIEAILEYIEKNKLIIKDGKLIKNE